MSEYRGLIVEYCTKDGEKQRAELRFTDNRKPSTAGNEGKALLRLTNADNTPKTEAGKQINKMVGFHKLTRIGFID